jgi:hypothetical protein
MLKMISSTQNITFSCETKVPHLKGRFDLKMEFRQANFSVILFKLTASHNLCYFNRKRTTL